jgi:hypothetical protein
VVGVHGYTYRHWSTRAGFGSGTGDGILTSIPLAYTSGGYWIRLRVHTRVGWAGWLRCAALVVLYRMLLNSDIVNSSSPAPDAVIC